MISFLQRTARKILPQCIYLRVLNLLDWRIATLADIKYAYRLFLNRKPDKHGYQTYARMLRYGNSISDLTPHFAQSQEFKAQIAALSQLSLKTIQMPGFQIIVNEIDLAVGREISILGHYEMHITAYLKAKLSAGMSFLDIGANIGYFSQLAASLVGPDGRVDAIEASPLNCLLNNESKKLNGFSQLKIHPFALAEDETFFYYDGIGSNGIIAPIDSVHISLAGNRQIVKGVRLDDLMQGRRIDIVKIDIEGAEFLALSNGLKLIQESRPIIISEFSPHALAKVSKTSGKDYLDFFIAQKYSIGLLQPDGKVNAFCRESDELLRRFEEKKAEHCDIVAMPDN